MFMLKSINLLETLKYSHFKYGMVKETWRNMECRIYNIWKKKTELYQNYVWIDVNFRPISLSSTLQSFHHELLYIPNGFLVPFAYIICSILNLVELNTEAIHLSQCKTFVSNDILEDKWCVKKSLRGGDVWAVLV